MFVDEPAEYRLLAALVDNPAVLRTLTPTIVTGARRLIFEAMVTAYTQYPSDFSTEGVERALGAPLPQEIEIARGAKPAALIDHLADLATRRQYLEVSDTLRLAAAAGDVRRETLEKMLQIPPVRAREDSTLAPGISGFLTDLRQKLRGDYRFVDTGIPFLNYMLGKEWPRQAMTIIMGKAGGGKCYDGDVWMADGTSKHISAVNAGDVVLSLNEATLRIEPRRVVAQICTGVQRSYVVTTARGLATTTSDVHPYLTQRGWVRTVDLRAGDVIATVGDDHDSPHELLWSLLDSVECVPDREMWDLEIEGTHTFIGNGVVLHNTALVCQSIMEMARLTIPSLFISLEMPKYRIVSRFVAYLARVDGMRLRAGTLTEEEIARVDQALAIIETLPIYIIDTPALAVDSILHQVRMHRELYGIEAVFVDYLQIVGRSSSTNANVNDSEELGYITQQLRNTAVELEIAAIGLSQQNRQYSGLQSILGSGRISHIADSVIEIEMEDTVSDTGRSVLFKVLKNRDGALGSFPGVYRPQHLYFE